METKIVVKHQNMKQVVFSIMLFSLLLFISSCKPDVNEPIIEPEEKVIVQETPSTQPVVTPTPPTQTSESSTPEPPKATEKSVKPEKPKTQPSSTKVPNPVLEAIPEEKLVEEIVIEEVLPKEEKIYLRAEEMPRFPGCENLKASNEEKDKCAQKKMYDYIHSKLKYPPQAVKNNIQGEVILKFVVGKTGKISDIEILEDPGYGMGVAVAEIIDDMNYMSQTWTPGKQHGESVPVWFMLPVKFIMNLDEIKAGN